MGIGEASLAWSISATALLFGLLVNGLDRWVTDGIVAFAATGLIYACRAWHRAVYGPSTTTKRER